MKIREATEKDIPEIIKVLKASLGEVSSKKTRSVWEFKHVNNPFGQSLVLVALDNNKVIGVRAFMRWKWQRGEKIFSCFRAVDTATHPEHQGKGIFKKLTLEAIRLATEEGGHFIFNTPNKQSLPGYLKMGWKKVGKLQVCIYPTNPIFWLGNNNFNYNLKILASEEELYQLCKARNLNLSSNRSVFFTPKTKDYLYWRYQKNPLQEYEVFSSEGLYIAGYIKKRKYFKELRIAELIASDNEQHLKAQKIINQWVKKFGATVISTAEDQHLKNSLKFQGTYGPEFTVRRLSLSLNEDKEIQQLISYSYSLGDLELF